jgi:hypothetical protein
MNAQDAFGPPIRHVGVQRCVAGMVEQLWPECRNIEAAKRWSSGVSCRYFSSQTRRLSKLTSAPVGPIARNSMPGFLT